MAKERYVRQHPPLRVPIRWKGEDRSLVIQLESILDDIYTKLGRLTQEDNHTVGEIAIDGRSGKAPKAISSGKYVVWNGGLYTARSNIAAGTVLSTTNLAEADDGGLNVLNSKMDTTEYDELLGDSNVRIGFVNKNNKVCNVTFNNKNGTFPSTGISFPAKYKADSDYFGACKYYNGSSDVVGLLFIAYNTNTIYLRNISGQNISGTYVTGTMVYFCV